MSAPSEAFCAMLRLKKRLKVRIKQDLSVIRTLVGVQRSLMTPCRVDVGCIWRYIGFMLGCVGTILARWPWLVGVYIVARRPGTHNTMMLFMLTPMLGSYGWAHVGPIWRNDGPKKRPNVRIKQDLLLIRTLADHIRPLLGLCWAYVGPNMTLCWPHVGLMLRSYWPIFPTSRNFGDLQKPWKNTVF